jgi:hypothetical protein
MLTSGHLSKYLRSSTTDIEAHLHVIDHDLHIENTRVKLHGYYISIDQYGRPRTKALAEFLRNQILDYAIPRYKISEARKRMDSTGSTAEFIRLENEAKKLFTNLKQTGEGGEVLLFVFAEYVFKLVQILCKMSLKTSGMVHFHGSDGIYAEIPEKGKLNLFWGESKVIKEPTNAIRECLKSLAPFLVEEDSEVSVRSRDLLLISDFVNIDDENVVEILKCYLDINHKLSLNTRNCGFAVVGFDSNIYNNENVTLEKLRDMFKVEIATWKKNVISRINAENLETLDIHFLCVPLPSVEQFRIDFLNSMDLCNGN